jgi:hypothetical protein
MHDVARKVGCPSVAASRSKQKLRKLRLALNGLQRNKNHGKQMVTGRPVDAKPRKQNDAK